MMVTCLLVPGLVIINLRLYYDFSDNTKKNFFESTFFLFLSNLKPSKSNLFMYKKENY